MDSARAPKAKKIQAHFETPQETWRQFRRELSKRGLSASLFLRECIEEFLQDETSTKSPLARYRRACCDGCPYDSACKGDKTVEFRCLLASLALSLSKSTKKTLLASAQL